MTWLAKNDHKGNCPQSRVFPPQSGKPEVYVAPISAFLVGFLPLMGIMQMPSAAERKLGRYARFKKLCIGPIYPLAIYPTRIYTRSMAIDKPSAPLTPAVLHILLALSSKERHGYGIMKQVESDSQGKVKMGPGTLYGSLGRMIEAGLIRESDKRVDPKMDDERRVYYKITGLGQKALAAELQRYREVVAVAKRLAPNACSYAHAR